MCAGSLVDCPIHSERPPPSVDFGERRHFHTWEESVEIASNILLVASLLCLAASVVTAFAQVIKDGLKGVKFMPSGAFFAMYAITFAFWLFL